MIAMDSLPGWDLVLVAGDFCGFVEQQGMAIRVPAIGVER